MPKIIIQNPDGTLVKYALNGRAFTVGRGPDNDIVLPPGAASTHHAVFKQLPSGDFSVTDLGSTNHTRVNGQVVQSMPLRNGDRILFGDVDVAYESDVPATATDDQPTKLYDPALSVPPAPAPHPQAVAPAGTAVPYVIQRPPAGTAVPRYSRSANAGCLTAAALCVILVLGFAAGLTWRHYQENDGEWLWDWLRAGFHSK